MFEEIPRGNFIKDKTLLKETVNFLDKIFNYVRKASMKKGREDIKEVGFTKLAYEDIVYDDEGWVDATKYAPSRFEMVVLKTKYKTANGWYKGGDWYSRKWTKNPKVLCWKLSDETFIGGPKDVG